MADHLNARTTGSVLVAGVALAVIGYGTASAGDASAGDPMRPSYLKPLPRAAGATGGGPRLQAVFGDQQLRVAIVSGQVLTVGGRVGAMTITRIDPHAVELRDGRRTVQLRMTGGNDTAGGDLP